MWTISDFSADCCKSGSPESWGVNLEFVRLFCRCAVCQTNHSKVIFFLWCCAAVKFREISGDTQKKPLKKWIRTPLFSPMNPTVRNWFNPFFQWLFWPTFRTTGNNSIWLGAAMTYGARSQPPSLPIHQPPLGTHLMYENSLDLGTSKLHGICKLFSFKYTYSQFYLYKL